MLEKERSALILVDIQGKLADVYTKQPLTLSIKGMSAI